MRLGHTAGVSHLGLTKTKLLYPALDGVRIQHILVDRASCIA